MVKISSYITKQALALTDYVLGNDATGPKTKRFLISDILAVIQNNLPAAEGTFPYIVSGGVWTGDSYGSTRAASMTQVRFKVSGTYVTVSAVAARLFTASKDTYVDLLDNLNGTGTLVYTEVANNAASPALAANSVRLAIIITGASNIANVGSINQGQEDKILPIVSQNTYTTTDSLGNLIAPRDPNRKVLGFKRMTSNYATATSGSYIDILPLAAPVIVPDGRKIKITIWVGTLASSQSGGNGINWTIQEGATVITEQDVTQPGTAYAQIGNAIGLITPSAGLHTYKTTYKQVVGTMTAYATANKPAFILIELV